MIIVDDYSRWSWVRFLKSKDDSYDVFSKFCIQIQSKKELKMSHLKYFVKNMESSMNSLLLELHNKMGL